MFIMAVYLYSIFNRFSYSRNCSHSGSFAWNRKGLETFYTDHTKTWDVICSWGRQILNKFELQFSYFPPLWADTYLQLFLLFTKFMHNVCSTCDSQGVTVISFLFLILTFTYFPPLFVFSVFCRFPTLLFLGFPPSYTPDTANRDCSYLFSCIFSSEHWLKMTFQY